MPNSPFLTNYINSLSTKQQRTVASLLQVAIDTKTNLQAIAANLDIETFNTFTPITQPTGGRISGNDWNLNFRNLNLLISALFASVNQVGLLLDANQKILLAQLAAAEKQLSALEKQAANFEFLLGTGNSFNYAYTETFHDILGKALNLSWGIPDRDNLGFNTDLQSATVLTASGELVLPQDVALPGAGLTVELIKSNASSFVTTNTGIENVLNSSSAVGWQYVVSSPNPITATIDPIFENTTGLQVILELTLSEPINCSQLQITPLASESVEIVEVRAYNSIDDRNGFSLQGTNNILINQIQTISFPLTTIQRFRLYINQQEYTRVLATQNNSETQFSRVYSNSGAAAKTVDNLGYDTISFDNLSENMQNFPVMSTIGLQSDEPDIADLLTIFKTRLGPQTRWCMPNPSNDLFLHLYSQWPGVFKTAFSASTQYPWIPNKTTSTLASVTNNTPPPITSFPSGTTNPALSTQYAYQYVLGLQSVRISVSIPEYKGVFVSNIIPSPGDMGVVVLNSSYSNYIDQINSLDNPVLTSVEFSVTNKSTPINENDWIPIFPLEDTSIASERLFPNASGACKLRFTANATEPLFVYKNGFQFTNYTQQLDTSFNNVIGISLQPKTYAPQDIMTVSYTPVNTSNIVDFTAFGFGDLPLLSASDHSGAGEGFSATVGNNTVQLSNIPFIDVAQLSTGVYQPITIILADGTVVTNLTNYITGVQPAFPTTGYYFIQSNNTLLFNRSITQPFRVYYQFLQNNVRFRVVLRSNSVNLVSPIVNLVQIKSETRLPNAIQVL